MNKAILHGDLAREVERRSTSTGKQVASTAIAINRRGTKDGQQQAAFIPLIAWRKTAEIFGKYLSKGSELLAEGRIQVRSYDDKNGNKKYITEIVVDSFDFCGYKNSGGTSGPATEEQAQFGQQVNKSDEDIPF